MSPFDCVNDVTSCIADMQHVHYTILFFLCRNLLLASMFLIAHDTMIQHDAIFSGTP